jgi:predicted acylesterase/phospholipase RssA
MTDGHAVHGAPPPGYVGPKRALVLSGGGVRLSYQAGALRALLEAGLRFHHVDATSGGSLTMAMLFCGLHPDDICDRWRTLPIAASLSLLPPEQYLRVRDLEALVDADSFRTKILPHLGIDVERLRSAQGVAGTLNVLDFSKKTVRVVDHGSITTDLLIAGLSLPGVYPPFRIDGDVLLDTGFVQDANVMEAVRRGADEIWLVWAMNNTARYRGGLFHLYMQMLEMSANGALNIALERISEINERIVKGERPNGRQQSIRLHVIRPQYPLPYDTDLYLGRVDSATLIDLGYADATAYLATHRESGSPLEPSVLQMLEPTRDVAFRETMAGPFALGESDARAGEDKGRRDGTELALHASVYIDDVDRFLDDPFHPGRLTGRIEHPAFGRNLPAKGGRFNLFWPSGDPALKLMTYALTFGHEGQDYHLAGRKEVRNDPGFDIWADTSTLYVRLHRGSDDSGAVIGAGVLKLAPGELAKMAVGIRSPGAASVADELAVVTKFGRYFLGEIHDVYVRRKSPWWTFWR